MIRGLWHLTYAERQIWGCIYLENLEVVKILNQCQETVLDQMWDKIKA